MLAALLASPLARASALCALSAAALLALPGEARAQVFVIPQGREAVVVEVVRGALEEAGLSPGVEISVERDRIVFTCAELGEPGGSAPAVIVRAPGMPAPDGAAELADGISLRCAADCSRAQRGRARSLATALERRRDARASQLWIEMVEAPGGEGDTLGRLLDAPDSPVFVWVFLGLFALGAVAAVGGVLAREGRAALLALAGLVGLAVLVRALVVHPQLMGVLSHNREVPWLFHLRRAGVPVLALLGDGASRFDQSFAANFAVSVVLVPVVYAHARVLLRDARGALVAAALFAFLPMTLAFARSEVLMLSSVLFTSVALTALERYSVATRPVLAGLHGLTVLVSFFLALESRPLNVLLLLVFVAALRAYSPHPLRSRRNVAIVVAAGLLVAFALARLAVVGRVTDAPVVGGALPGATELLALIRHLPGILLVDNDYFLPDLLPLFVTALAVLGGLRMRREDRDRLVYLLLWFALVYAGHALVSSKTRIIAARYGIHSLLPVVILASYGLGVAAERFGAWWPAVPWRRPLALAGAVAAVLLSTLPTAWLLERRDDDHNQERRFLEELWARGVPEPGALVLEGYDDNEAARYPYVGIRVRGAAEDVIAKSVAEPHPGAGPQYLYLGLPCLWRRPEGRPISPRCEALLSSFRVERVAARRITGSLHDVSSGRLVADGGEVVLHRILGPAAP